VTAFEGKNIAITEVKEDKDSGQRRRKAIRLRKFAKTLITARVTREKPQK